MTYEQQRLNEPDPETVRAAAPELLDALEALLEASGDDRTEPAQVAAQAAIRKARGEGRAVK